MNNENIQKPTVAFHTLGCKVNQYETQKITEDFITGGFLIRDFSEFADVYVINTCTVTHIADSKSRQAIRAAANRNPNAFVIVTGCYAETSGDAVASIDGVTCVLRNSEKAGLIDSVVSLFPPEIFENKIISDTPKPKSRTRALLKIQDGCDQFCSYCAVPLARSVMWNKPFSEAIDEAQNLVDRGYKEIVLTGVRTGLYHDKKNLTDIIDRMSEIDGLERIRISSIETTDIPDGLIELMSSNNKVCRHLHLPLQSGDDTVLARMNRPYTSGEFLDLVYKIKNTIPDAGITTDIIVGFPGEGSMEFDNTCKIVNDCGFSRSHIFKYSSRKGTAASRFADNVPFDQKEDRRKILSKITNDSADRFAERFVNKQINILVEGKIFDKKLLSGLTDNYLRVFIKADDSFVNKIIKVNLNNFVDGKLFGIIV